MVLFPDAVAKGGGRLASETFEKPIEIGGIVEAKRIANLFYGEVRVKEESFAFEYDALMDEAGGCSPCVLAYYVVEVARTYIQQLGIVGHLVQRVVSVADELFKTTEE